MRLQLGRTTAFISSEISTDSDSMVRWMYATSSISFVEAHGVNLCLERRMHGARRNLRLALQSLAFGQAGYFTAAQAVDLGYGYQAQKYHVDNGNWLRIDRGLFQLPDWPAYPDD